ncbi:hypothetical protein CMI44_00675 [Candidatus Pacearchaeota archaeon]|nr:hypothetical protein [Candidatus Pacearchaeota archaeon]|tara:strand:+ start:1063 stop:1908 length:846 start_codon:yes stop_codon:yes gene_type:complete
MKNAELHTHSCYSDGQISPVQLVRLAKKRRIKNLALTDHNSVKGIKEAIREGKRIGVNIIPAIEVSCDKGEVLGYFIDIKNRKLINEIRRGSKKIQDSIKDRCDKLSKKGYNIRFSELQRKYPKARGNINMFYIFYELFLKGYGETRKIVKELEDQKEYKRKVKRMSLIQGIRLIRGAGGVPVLAHPWIDDEVLKEKNFREYIKEGLKGIEINNGDRAPLRLVRHSKRMKNLIKKYKLIATSGSDYHGKALVKHMSGNHELGANNCDEKVVEELGKLSKNR